jgi:hypothetical protein
LAFARRGQWGHSDVARLTPSPHPCRRPWRPPASYMATTFCALSSSTGG